MPEFRFQEMFELSPDDTAYRPIGGPGLVAVEKLGGREILAGRARGAAPARRRRDARRLAPVPARPSRAAARILDDPEASENDRFVALEMLKNANVSAGMVLPSCQDTGTAIVIGKKGQNVFTGANDEEWLSRGVFDTYVNTNLRYSQMAPLSMYDEKNTGTNLPAQVELYATPRRRVPRSCSSPRAAARRTRASCTRRRARSSTPRTCCASSTRRSARSAPRRARRITSPS